MIGELIVAFLAGFVVGMAAAEFLTWEEIIRERDMIEGPIHERSLIWHLFELPRAT